MAIELVNGGSVTCVDNNYNITYNGTALRRIYACDTANNVAWRIPGKGEPGGLLSMGLHRVRHD